MVAALNPVPPDQAESRHKLGALWATVILEGVMIIAVGACNIYEIRRSSELLQGKIEGLSKYSARQGEKIDRMTTALELYVGKKLADSPATATTITTDEKIDKAIEFFEAWKQRGRNVQENSSVNEK